MRIRNRIVLSALVICGFTGVSIFLLHDSAVTGHSQDSASETSFALLEKVNQKARQVKRAKEIKNKDKDSKEVETAVSELTDAVLESFGAGTEQLRKSNSYAAGLIASEVEEVKGRLMRSEIKYRNEHKAGIPEEKVVNVINDLAEAVEAPKYAKTDKYEVRKLRVWMLGHVPEFVSREHPAADGGVKDKHKKSLVSPLMSPLEATYVTALLVNQKRVNDEYQLTPEERRIRWSEKHARKAAGREDDTPRIAPQTERQVEMSKVVGRALSGMSLTEQKRLGHKALDVLGMEQ